MIAAACSTYVWPVGVGMVIFGVLIFVGLALLTVRCQQEGDDE